MTHAFSMLTIDTAPSSLLSYSLLLSHSGWRCSFAAPPVPPALRSVIRRSPFLSLQTTVATSAYMERLADVELQLVMHGLDARSLLQFARCSRPLLHAADHPFAWLHASLHILGWQVESASSPCSPPSRLLRHARLSVRFDNSRPTEQGNIAVEAQQFVDALRSLASPLHHLTCTDSTKPRISLQQWQQILGAPSARHLRTLHVVGCMYGLCFDDSTVHAIARLPHLHTLVVERCAAHPDMWAALHSAPALTSLRMVDMHAMQREEREERFGNSCLQHVRQCSKLTHLDIWSFALQGDGFDSFFAGSPHMRQLHSLQLTCLECADVPSAAYMSAFSALEHMHSLHLARCASVNSLLPHLRCAVALLDLTLEVAEEQVTQDEDTPSTSVVADLLLAAPLLHCVLLLHTEIVDTERLDEEALAARRAELLRAQQHFEEAEEIKPLGARFLLQPCK